MEPSDEPPPSRVPFRVLPWEGIYFARIGVFGICCATMNFLLLSRVILHPTEMACYYPIFNAFSACFFPSDHLFRRGCGRVMAFLGNSCYLCSVVYVVTKGRAVLRQAAEAPGGAELASELNPIFEVMTWLWLPLATCRVALAAAGRYTWFTHLVEPPVSVFFIFAQTHFAYARCQETRLGYQLNADARARKAIDDVHRALRVTHELRGGLWCSFVLTLILLWSPRVREQLSSFSGFRVVSVELSEVGQIPSSGTDAKGAQAPSCVSSIDDSVKPSQVDAYHSFESNHRIGMVLTAKRRRDRADMDRARVMSGTFAAIGEVSDDGSGEQ